ncbi:hypothetical protein ACOMHN_024932 [Nucella lapillus]
MSSLSTQDMPDGLFDSEEEDPGSQTQTPWGRLFPLGESFWALDLVKEEYMFGRGEKCDVSFSSTGASTQCFQAYSKVHFTLSREWTSAGVFIFLEDKSSNGTFVNGEKVGKGNRQVLSNSDEIALAMKKNKAYMFMDLNAKEDSDFPKELTDKYTITRLLGRGACGEVRLAFLKGSCERFACKIISKKKFSVGGTSAVNMSSQVMVEVQILKSLNHPCIIRVEDVIDTPDMLYILLELVEGGELFDKVVSISKYPEAIAKLLFYQMLCACKVRRCEYLEETAKLLFYQMLYACKVTDFGLSKFVDEGSLMKTFCGTPSYLAPEVLLTAGSGSYTQAIDCWSLGVVLFIMVSGYPPFSDQRKDIDLPQQIMGGHYTFPEQYWQDVSNEVIDLIQKLLTVDPKARITLSDALLHPWVQPLGKKRSLDGGEEGSAAKR